jgi:hypothetical protein
MPSVSRASLQVRVRHANPAAGRCVVIKYSSSRGMRKRGVAWFGSDRTFVEGRFRYVCALDICCRAILRSGRSNGPRSVWAVLCVLRVWRAPFVEDWRDWRRFERRTAGILICSSCIYFLSDDTVGQVSFELVFIFRGGVDWLVAWLLPGLHASQPIACNACLSRLFSAPQGHQRQCLAPTAWHAAWLS